MNYLFSIFFILFYSANIRAQYTFAIYTDQQSEMKAKEVIEYFNDTEPFSKYSISFRIIKKTKEEISCHLSPQISRLLICDTKEISVDAAKKGYDQAFVVYDSEQYAGSGGAIPAITSAKTSSASMMMHEYLHTIGFADEYAYSKAEAKIYCLNGYEYLNLAVITPESFYQDDQFARDLHKKEIPWYSLIKTQTPISNKILGTPSSNQKDLGLFSSKTCQHAVPKITAWKPGYSTIMEKLSRPIGPLSPLVELALESLGVSRKTQEDIQASPPPHRRDFKRHNCSVENTKSVLPEETKQNLRLLKNIKANLELYE